MQGRSGFRMRHKISRRNWQGGTGRAIRFAGAQSPVPRGLFKRFDLVRFARCLDVQPREAPKIVPPLGPFDLCAAALNACRPASLPTRRAGNPEVTDRLSEAEIPGSGTPQADART